MKLLTKTEIPPLEEKITLNDAITSFGSCFATEMGQKMADMGYWISNNPFGVLFNPASIASSIRRLASGEEFTEDDVIDRDPLYGTKAALKEEGALQQHPKSYASFYHHSSFASPDPSEFLEKANNALHEAAGHYAASKWIIVTFGTAWVFRHIEKDIIVSNCHKRPAREFRREFLPVDEIYALFAPLLNESAGSKRWIFTVSPIRHLSDTLHGNQLSKATLLLAVERLRQDFPNAFYFPAYEIVLDELRDYKYFAQDLVHPSEEAVEYVWNYFKNSCTN